MRRTIWEQEQLQKRMMKMAVLKVITDMEENEKSTFKIPLKADYIF